MVRSCHEKGGRIILRREKRDEDVCGGEEKERKTEAEVDGQCECGLESDEDGCGGEEKERKTEAEVDGQWKCGFVEHRIDIEVGKYAAED